MEFQEGPYTFLQKEFIQRRDEAGIVLDIRILQPNDNTNGIYHMSKEAALYAMKLFAEDSESYYKITIAKTLKGVLIPFSEFIGPGYNF